MYGPPGPMPADPYRSRLFRLVCQIVAQGSRHLDDGSDDATRSRVIAVPESSVLDLFSAVIDGRQMDTEMLSDNSDGEIFVAGDVEINPAFREVKKSGKSVHLTPREYDLLLSLARRSGIRLRERISSRRCGRLSCLLGRAHWISTLSSCGESSRTIRRIPSTSSHSKIWIPIRGEVV
jgi:hypothetical protein